MNADGELVGVNAFILSESGGSQGLGFAIPSAVVAAIYPDLLKYGRVRRGAIGLEVQANNPDFAAGLSLGQTSGVLISDVLPDGPASRAGVQPGDIVLALGGRPTPTIPLFGLEMATRKPADTLTMDLLRGTQRISVSMTVMEDSSADPRLVARADPSANTVARLGIVGVDVAGAVASLIPKVREPSGVFVAAREARSQGTENPLSSGDVIHRINGLSVRSIDGLRAILDGFKAGTRVVVQIERQGRLRFLVVRLGT